MASYPGSFLPAMPGVMREVAATAPSDAGAWRWWLVLACTGLMLCLPFLAPFKAPPVPSFHAEILAGALGLLALCLTWVFRRADSVPLPWTLALPALLGMVLLAQMLTGFLPAQQLALLTLLYLLWAAGLIIVGGVLRSELGLERCAAALAWFILAGGVASALAGTAQLLGLHWLSAWVMPTASDVWGNLGQRNHFAAYLAMAMASLLFLWSAGRLAALPALVMALLLAWLLPMSGSRSVWLYAGAFVALALIWHRRERSRLHRNLVLACAGVIFAMLAAEWLWGAAGVLGLAPATSLERLRDIHSGERSHIWGIAWRMFTEHPWTGVGHGQFAWHYFLLNGADPAPQEGYTHHAHNLLLHVGAELGLGGIVALILGAGCWWLAARALEGTPGSWWLLCIFAVLGIHAMLEYPLWYAYFLGVAAVVLGLCGGRTLEFRPTRLLRAMVLVCLVLSGVVLAQLFRDYVYLENFLAFRYRFIDATAQVNARAKEMLLDIRKTSLLAPYVELGLARAIEVDRNQLDAKLQVNGHAMRAFPVDDVVYRQAMLWALKGQVATAARQWDLARASYPQIEPMALSVLSRRAGDLGDGLEPLLEHVQANTRR